MATRKAGTKYCVKKTGGGARKSVGAKKGGAGKGGAKKSWKSRKK
jgi:hypothetical protein